MLTRNFRESVVEARKEASARCCTEPPVIRQQSKCCGGDGGDDNDDLESDFIIRTVRDSLCSPVSDSEVRESSDSCLFDTSCKPFVSKDANWTLTNQASPMSPLKPAAPSSATKNPCERAEQLLAVLKHRLFSAQLNNYKSSIRRKRSEMRHSLQVGELTSAAYSADDDDDRNSASWPARPNTLKFLPQSKSAGSRIDQQRDDSIARTTWPADVAKGARSTTHRSTNTPPTTNPSPASSVRALVQVLENRCSHPPPPTPPSTEDRPTPTASAAVAAVATAAATPALRAIAKVVVTTDGESPASKDEGYSTMSSDVQVGTFLNFPFYTTPFSLFCWFSFI